MQAPLVSPFGSVPPEFLLQLVLLIHSETGVERITQVLNVSQIRPVLAVGG